MKIIEILKQRNEKSKSGVKIELKLYDLADKLENRCRTHLKRISLVMSEFDIHDEKHSEKVIENIEMLLGDDKLNSLSTYELFLLHLSAFFHDCAMAPSDWEINTMKLTEGNEQYFQDDLFSIKHDLKTPLTFSDAEKIIEENKEHLYKDFESDIKIWMFTPHNEIKLIEYLSSLLIEYQNHRNGFADKLKTVKNKSEFIELNEFIRIDYIRTTHHIRVETYIKNLETMFGDGFEQSAWGKKLAQDLSLICRSHGEDISFIEKLKTNAQYYGSETTNLQFVAILLRLGDIIHFSYDRAPVDLRSSKLFKSEYSFQQWAIKNSGVNYSIEKGKISFRAYCENPDIYFKLHQYIDGIEIEIQNYFRFQRQWDKKYVVNLLDKVDRSGITNDEEAFLPKRGLSFSLNQTKIIDLLMGVGLYKDKFACLRELYQNSLDAVRCMLSQNETEHRSASGNIEFNIEKEEDKTYLCCIDNGIGMTKEVIENYLLKIGNSYYKSADFYKQQAKWGGKFAPTSQFGIGILSCFMIGDKIEITTKTENNEYISCAIDGPHENFYYKKSSLKDEENIPVSGTIVKVLLNDEIENQINNKKINKIGLLLSLSDFTDDTLEEFSHFPFYTKEVWNSHLFKIMTEFIITVPKNINVVVGVEDGTKLAIPSNPIIIDFENPNLEIEPSDFKYIDEIFEYRNKGKKYENLKNLIETYKFSVLFENTEFVTTLTLPKKYFLPESRNFVYENWGVIYKLPTTYKRGIQIDGISNDWRSFSDIFYESDSDLYWSKTLYYYGFLTFYGEVRPQLSVDRQKIINYPRDCERIVENISKLLAKKIVSITKEYVNKNEFTANDIELIWEYVFRQFSFVGLFIIEELLDTECINITSEMLNLYLSTKQNSIIDFFNSESIVIDNLKLLSSNDFVQNLICLKLLSANEISVDDSKVSVIQRELQLDFLDIVQKCDFFPITSFDFYLLICANSWNILGGIYDIVSDLYPLIPKRLFDLLCENKPKEKYSNEVYIYNVDKKIKMLKAIFSDYGESIYAGLFYFFTQDPLMVNDKQGLYYEDRWNRNNFQKQKSKNIYKFNKKITFSLPEINQKTGKDHYVLVVFISPYELTTEQNKELKKYETIDPSYVKGVKEGWSLLVTGMGIDNVVIYPGITTREHLVSLISDEFWETYNDIIFKFTDNTIMTK